MISIQLDKISKRFQFEWIFKDISLNLDDAKAWAITGSNGSGKSTLLKCISGQLPLTSGSILYSINGNSISDATIYQHLVISAPYLELPEEFTLQEVLGFHFKFKKAFKDLSIKKMIDIMYLSEHKNKTVSQFSSGMKQRLKLGLCFFSDVPLILLDEPSSNLDNKGCNWYLSLVDDFGRDRKILVCSNEPKEYGFCKQNIVIEHYKTRPKL
ncbi:ABC transporter ATP-binding protein [Mongoliitalea lutea]|uniref:ATP-binding protein n=1 Tax=Mongoliitalea lutea TaxID=849756 RepID=A0A8J3G5V5_9BACT|nr:ATP-binding cassette domain-containing protein [Mongoliitalea lutea]GHB42439.1 ATP-binding protein [Mongoliitalea lutea]